MKKYGTSINLTDLQLLYELLLFFLQIAYTEEFEHQRGKGSFPAMITPGYYLAKKAQENASDVSINADLWGLLT